MAEKWGNIDLVFRNGLKDFEVLPPPEVWDNIHPVIKKQNNLFPLLKTAATIAVIVSIGVLAYRWGMEVSSEELPELISDNQVQTSPVVYPASSVNPGQKREIVNDVYNKPVESAPEIIAEEFQADVTEVVSEKMNLEVSRYLLSDYESSQEIQNPAKGKFVKISPPELEAVKYEFIPENIEMPVINRWAVSATATPTYHSQFTSSGNDLAKQIMESDQARVSYTGGVGLAYKISSRFSIQSGLYYSSIGQEMSGINAYSGFQAYDNSKGGPNFEVLTTNGTVTTSNSDIFLSSYTLPERIITSFTKDVFDPVKASLNYVSSTLYQDLSFLELPVIVRYKVIDRKVGINLIGGMSYNFLVKNDVYAVLDEGRYPVGTTDGLNDVSLSSSLGMGMEYKLSQNLSLNLEPTFRYYLNPFSSARTAGIHPYSIGIFSGLAYKF